MICAIEIEKFGLGIKAAADSQGIWGIFGNPGNLQIPIPGSPRSRDSQIPTPKISKF